MQDYLAQPPGVVQQTTIRTARACANSALMGAGACCSLLLANQCRNRQSCVCTMKARPRSGSATADCLSLDFFLAKLLLCSFQRGMKGHSGELKLNDHFCERDFQQPRWDGVSLHIGNKKYYY